MTNHVYKQIELTGSSTQSSDDAIRCGARKSLKDPPQPALVRSHRHPRASRGRQGRTLASHALKLDCESTIKINRDADNKGRA